MFLSLYYQLSPRKGERGMLLYIITLLIYTIMLNILIIIKQAIYQIIF